jgi:hypothetical protein
MSRDADAIVWPSSEALAREIGRRIGKLPYRSASVVRHLRREYSRRLRESPDELILRLARQLTVASTEQRFFAAELLHNHSAFSGLGRTELELLGQGMDSWSAVDVFSLYLRDRHGSPGRFATL